MLTIRSLALALLFLLVVGVPAVGAQPVADSTLSLVPAPAAVAADDDGPSARSERPIPVFLGGRELMSLRAGRDGMGARDRATAIRDRLVVAVADTSIAASDVRLVPRENAVEFRLGRRLLFVLVPEDLPPLDRTETEAWLQRLAREVREGIARERASRDPRARLMSVAIGAAWTLGAWLLALAVLALGRRWRWWLHTVVSPRLPAIRVRNTEVLSRRQLASLLLGVLGRADLPVLLVLGYTWLTTVFARFPVTQSWSWELRRFAIERSSELVRIVLASLPGLLTVVFILWVFRAFMQLSDRFFDRVARGATTLPGFHPELAAPSRRLARIVLGLAAIITAYPYLPGAESKAVQGISVLVGLMVSLGSSGIVGNMIAGLVLTYSRSFSIGDRVRIGDHVGDVISLGTFATKLRSLRNEEVTLPNGAILSGTILNYTRRTAQEGGLWLHTQVTIGYDAPWRQVHALLIEAARSVPGVEPSPEPIVYQRALNDYHVSYEITCLTHDSHAQLRLYSDLHAAIQDAFARAGVEILSPAYAALRDANAPVLPSEPSGPREMPGGFRVRRPGE